MNITLLKWLKWEFWPFWFFYIPLYIKYLWMSLKAGTMAFFTASNPLMELGGLTDYSKYNVLKHINPTYLPQTFLLKRATIEEVLNQMKKGNLTYPIILKPDIGERGFGVEKIDNLQDLQKYFKQKKGIDNLIIQDYADFPIEIGVMYSRKSSEQKGIISSVVIKEFLKITGDGKRTFQEIITQDERAKFYQESLEELYKDKLQSIPEKGKVIEPLAIGNHCRGTMFLDRNHLINEQLVSVFDTISIPIKGFHFGRFDLRVSSIEDLYKGKNIKILELNGAASEPAHIYDPNMPLLKAYKHLFGHWQRLYEISIENHKNGVSYHTTWEVFQALRQRGKFKKSITNNI